MKTFTIHARALALGWEANVHRFAVENGIEMQSPEDYQRVREMKRLGEWLEKAIMKQTQLSLQIDVTQKRILQIRKELSQ